MWVHNVVLFLFTLTSPAVTVGTLQTVGLEKKLTKPTFLRSHNSRCTAYAMAAEEADESSCKAVALCADVEVAEREGAVAMVEDVVLRMAEVDVVVVRLPCQWSCMRTGGAMVMTETRRGSCRRRAR